MKSLTKKQKVLIGVLVPVCAIVLVLIIVMSVAVVRSKADRTVASGTLSMLGNLIRAKSSVHYESFGNGLSGLPECRSKRIHRASL